MAWLRIFSGFSALLIRWLIFAEIRVFSLPKTPISTAS
jgi:hypothetical protein